MADLIPIIGIAATFCFVAYKLGRVMGAADKLEEVSPTLEVAYHYRLAVDDLDRWCGHESPHARIIARYLNAMGERTGHNAGTPLGDEACGIGGLRQQLRRLDAAQQPAKEPR